MTDDERAALVERVTLAIATDQIRLIFTAAGLIGDDLQDAFISMRISVAAVAAIEPAIRADERARVVAEATTRDAVGKALTAIYWGDKPSWRVAMEDAIRAALGVEP